MTKFRCTFNFVVSPSSDYLAIGESYDKYMSYVDRIWSSLPDGLKVFISQSWYYVHTDPRCPHDAIVESLELNNGNLTMILRNERHGHLIKFKYIGVKAFFINTADSGLNFWYDEFEMSSFSVTHKIAGNNKSQIYVECSDVHYESAGSKA